MPIPQQSRPPEDPPDQESPPDTRGFIAFNRDNLMAIRDAIRSKKGLTAQTKINLEHFLSRIAEDAQFIGPDCGTAYRTLQDWAEVFGVSYKTIVGWRDHLESINVTIEDAKGQIEMPLITTVRKGFQRDRHNRRTIRTAEGQFKKPQRGNSGAVLKLNVYAGLTGRGGDNAAIRISPAGVLLKNTHPKELKSKAFNTSEGETPNVGTEKMGTEVEEANDITQSEFEFSNHHRSGIDSQATPKAGGLRKRNQSVSPIAEAMPQLDRAKDRATASGAAGPSGSSFSPHADHGRRSDPEENQSYVPFTKEKLKESAPDESRLSYPATLAEIDRLVGFTLRWNDEKQIRAYYDALTGETIADIVERHLERIQGARRRCGYVLGLLKKYDAGELDEEDRDQKTKKAGLTGMMQRAPKKGQPIRVIKSRCVKQGRHNQQSYWNIFEKLGVEQVFQKDEKLIKTIADNGDEVGNTDVLRELRRMADTGFKVETVDDALSKVKEQMSDSHTYDVPHSAIA